MPVRTEDPPIRPVVRAEPAPVKLRGLEARQAAAASNRGLVTSTALTVPEGKVEVTLQVVVPAFGIAGLNAGLTKSTELWVDGATSLGEGDGNGNEATYGAGIKQVLLHGHNASLALTGAVRAFPNGYNSSRGWKSLGAVGSLCTDDSCYVMISGGVQRLFGFHASYDGYSDETDAATMFTLNGSLGTGTTRFLVDFVKVGRDRAGFLGLRLGSRLMAFDLGFARPLSDYGGEQTIPWVGVTGRM